MVRVKHRYLVAQILYPEPVAPAPKSDQAPLSTLSFRRPTPPSITSAHLIRLIRETISEIFGDYGAGVCAGSLFIKYYSATTSTLIIRCARERSRLVWTALTLITNLPAVVHGKYRAGVAGPSCVFRVVHHSGTIRKSEEKIIQMARNEIFLMRKAGEVVADDVLLSLGGRKDGVGEGSVVMADADYEGEEDREEDWVDLSEAD